MKGNRKSEIVKEWKSFWWLQQQQLSTDEGTPLPVPMTGCDDQQFPFSFQVSLSFFLSLYSILAENFICWSNFLFFELLLLLLLDFKRFHPNLPRISEEDQHWIGQPKAIDRFLLFLSAGRMAKHPPATERSTERERETHTHTGSWRGFKYSSS